MIFFPSFERATVLLNHKKVILSVGIFDLMGPKILLSHQSLKMRLWYIYRVSHMDGHEIRRILSTTFMCDHFFLIRRVKNLSYYIGVSKQEKNGYTQYYSITSISIQETLYLHTQAVYTSNRHQQVKEISKPYISKKTTVFTMLLYCAPIKSTYQIFFSKQYLRKLIQYHFQIA